MDSLEVLRVVDGGGGGGGAGLPARREAGRGALNIPPICPVGRPLTDPFLRTDADFLIFGSAFLIAYAELGEIGKTDEEVAELQAVLMVRLECISCLIATTHGVSRHNILAGNSAIELVMPARMPEMAIELNFPCVSPLLSLLPCLARE